MSIIELLPGTVLDAPGGSPDGSPDGSPNGSPDGSPDGSPEDAQAFSMTLIANMMGVSVKPLLSPADDPKNFIRDTITGQYIHTTTLLTTAVFYLVQGQLSHERALAHLARMIDAAPGAGMPIGMESHL